MSTPNPLKTVNMIPEHQEWLERKLMKPHPEVIVTCYVRAAGGWKVFRMMPKAEYEARKETTEGTWNLAILKKYPSASAMRIYFMEQQ